MQNITLVVYRDANGVPGAKLAESFPQFIPAQSPGRWWGFPCHETPLVAGAYWIVIFSSANDAGIVRDYGDGTGKWYGTSDVFDDTAESPFGTGSAGTLTLSVYALYLTGAERRVAGRASIAAVPSKGLTADFKRAVKFTMPTTGRLASLTAYLDGKGSSGTLGQGIGFSLYRDQGGVPGRRIADTNQFAIWSGQPASWNTMPATPISLTPGTYWIALHTGAASGVIRDFGDGSEPNWYGNADTFSDGAAAQFGAGSLGNNTMSAAVLYDPVVQIHTFGRTSIGSQPSKGLPADFIHGLWVGDPSGIPNRASATALYAYLDGNGGASGSQQLRMVLFNTDSHGVSRVAAQSDVITVSAGMSPRWVRFQLHKPIWMELDEYVVALHSGGTGGVVRSYGGDSPDNWVGAPDIFADGADGEPGLQTDLQFGTGTPSMYLEWEAPAPAGTQ
jgi:hypothetical protein